MRGLFLSFPHRSPILLVGLLVLSTHLSWAQRTSWGKEKYLVGSAPSKWLTFAPTYGNVPHDMTYRFDNLDHFGHHIPWVGSIILRIAQQAKAHPHLTRRPSDLIFDGAGNLYGTTSGEGINNQGTVFRLTPQSSGKWSETVLFKFNGKNGADPSAGLIHDAAGNLFGTTVDGGASGDGTVFELIP